MLGSAVEIISFVFKKDIVCVSYWNQAREVNDLPSVILEPAYGTSLYFYHPIT